MFNPADPHPVPITTGNVHGVVSLIFWSVMLIVTLMYVTLVMRADNDGEGGVMALITLVRRFGTRSDPRVVAALSTLGILGAALFFGDSMITPAISVLSAVEGLKVVDPDPGDFVVPITAGIIIGLFAVQRFALAAVVLAVTGAEALYGDLGHFSRAQIPMVVLTPRCARFAA